LALQIKHYGGVANAISLMNEKIEKMPEILIQINSIIKRPLGLAATFTIHLVTSKNLSKCRIIIHSVV
jgi:hypothetical protein